MEEQAADISCPNNGKEQEWRPVSIKSEPSDSFQPVVKSEPGEPAVAELELNMTQLTDIMNIVKSEPIETVGHWPIMPIAANFSSAAVMPIPTNVSSAPLSTSGMTSLLENQLRGNFCDNLYNSTWNTNVNISSGDNDIGMSSMTCLASGSYNDSSNTPDTNGTMTNSNEHRRCIMLADLPSTSNPQGTSSQASDKSSTNPFHVNTNQIQAVPLSQQASELQDLGLTVFNQDEFEEGVMAQVDQAMQAQEEERLKKLMERELKEVQEEAKTTKQELNRIEKALKLSQPNPTDKETKRRLMAIKQQRENKMKQLKKLKAKQKKLMIRVQGNADGLDDDGIEEDDEELPDLLGLGRPNQETEMERRIRMGEMTPFGNVVKPSGPRLSTAAEMSDFDKYLLDQGSKRILAKGKTVKKAVGNQILQNEKSADDPPVKKSKLHKSKSAPLLKKTSSTKNDLKGSKNSLGGSITGSSKGSPIKRKVDGNLFDAKDKRSYRPSERDFSKWTTNRYKRRYPKFQHNFSGDPNISDYEDNDEDCYYDDADYVPDEREMEDSFIDEETGGEIEISPKKKRTIGQKGLKRESVSDNDVDYCPDGGGDSESDLGSIKANFKKHSPRFNKASSGFRDDGDYKAYQNRIKTWKKQKLVVKKEKIDRGEDESESEDDMELDGGFKVPGKMWKKLYRYQQTGVQWLWELHHQQAGGIVGDEMGLGKTIQIIAFLTGLRNSKLPDRSTGTRYRGLGPTLIICPTTVMHQWVKEFHSWWPAFRVAVLHSTGSSTTSAVNLVQDVVESHGVLITAFSTTVIKQEILLEHDWHYVILDEGHKIRNPDAQVTIACKQFRTCHRIILSGSPVQNNLKELWSLFDFVFPGKLGTLPDFMSNFSVPIVQGGYANATQVQVQTAYKCACVLRDTINPYLLRRMKSDVKSALQLPSKNEQVLFCRLTPEQREVYQEYLDSKECDMILSGNFMVFPGLITLRKICNHPDISTGGPKEFGSIPEGYDEESVEYGHWRRSGKMVVVQALLKLWKKQGHRVLLFSQSREMLTIIEKYVMKQGYTYMRMDGSTSISARQPLISKFNNDSSIFLFLLTTRVGGLGVNLIGANRVVIFDPDWNPSTDTQARERAWRIGQTRQVTIYRLMTSGTIEEKIYHRQIFKQFLSNRVLKDPKQRRFFKSNDLFELFTLGDDDPKNCTETSAIFAGTGSDVKVRSKAKYRSRASEKRDSEKPNRFDELRAKKKAEESATWDEDVDDQGDNSMRGNDEVEIKKEEGQTVGEVDVSLDHLAKMRELARKLSFKIGKKSNAAAGAACTESGKASVQNSDGSQDGVVESCSKDSGSSSQHFGGDGSCPSKMSDGVIVGAAHRSSGGQNSADTMVKIEKPDLGHRKDKQKHKKKKKRKDAKFEGERIANLDSVSVFKTGEAETEDKKTPAQGDDYVLQKLFKKSGVHSAMQHDKIMMSSNPDYALVEAEADRVAREAAQALKASRARCMNVQTGVPTWTGQSGAAGAPGVAKPRFGLKKNSRLLPTATAVKPESPKPAIVKGESIKKENESKEGRHFDGSLAGGRKTLGGGKSSSLEVFSSGELLAKMKARNHLTKFSNGQVQNDQESGPSADLDSSDIEMITDVRNFVACQARVDGQATTKELLEEFTPRMPTDDTAKFKAMLKQVCTLDKSNGVGIWYLKPEFR